MITYSNHVKETTTLRCRQEDWQRMTQSAQTVQYIEQFRKTGVVDWKQRLPAVNFQGYDPQTVGGGKGTRKADRLKPSGLFMLDIDHCSQMGLTPSQCYNKFLSTIKGLTSDVQAYMTATVALCHKTPSGDGLRIVMKGRTGSTIQADQKWLAGLMGVGYDSCTKDLSRMSFVPMAKDVYFINAELLFGEPMEDVYTTEATATTTQTATTAAVEGDLFQDYSQRQQTDAVSGRFPADYRGIAYTEIVERLINQHGGTPQMGERHAMIITLANDLKTITDSTIDWMMELIPSFGKSREEKRNAIQWAVQHNTLGQSNDLRRVLKELKAAETEPESETEGEETKKAADKSAPEMPAQLPRLIALCTSKVMPFQRAAVASMIFPALSTHIAGAWFVALDRKKFRNSMMCVLTGKQSVGKGCVDEPIERIIQSILDEDEAARLAEREWAESQQAKKANEKGSARPKSVIRILNSDVTPAAMLNRLFAAENYGERKNLFTFTKVDEVDELYTMCPTAGRSRITQLIRKCWDCGRIGSERFTVNAANYQTTLAWNWCASGTIDKVKRFFSSSLSDGTVSRVDFATIIPPNEDYDFVYKDYDDDFDRQLQPYLENLQNFKCEKTAQGKVIPLETPELIALEKEMNRYITDYSKTLEDDTWRDYAWRTKVISLKKILVLYIANGCQWEDTFRDFFFWSFHYSMWCKMQLFYEKASEAFESENFIAKRQLHSPLDYLPEVFSRKQFYEAVQRGGFRNPPANILTLLIHRKTIQRIDKNTFCRNTF